MSGQATCPRCQTPLAAGTSPEACPRCLLEAALSDGGTDSPTGRPEPPSPAELSERFPDLEILELVGQGGMGIVYRARQVKLDRIVALKILPASIAESPDFATRFAREARTMARLDHPNIVRIYEFGEMEGLYYLVMEFVDGSNLRPVIEGGGLAPAEALAIVPQICEALQYAHERGVVHRDIKPENVLLTRDGQVKLTDFGLAKLVDATPGERTLTNAGQVMGTIHYMAPEQYRTPKDVDHRADIYSLGVVFYEMLTGEVPMGHFQAPSEKVHVDVRLDHVVLRSLEKERERRYQHASDVRNEVTGIVDTPGATAAEGAAPAEPAASAAPSGAASPPGATKPPLSRLAVWGFILTFSSILIGPLMVFALVAPAPAVEAESAGRSLAGILPVIPLAMVLAGFILSVAGWIRIARSDGRLRGLGYAITGAVVAVPILFAMLVMSLLFVRAEPVEDGPTLRGGVSTPAVVAEGEDLAARTNTARVTEAYAQVEGMWNELQGLEKVTPSDLNRLLLHPVEVVRMQESSGEDLMALHTTGLLWTRPAGETRADWLKHYSLDSIDLDGDPFRATAVFKDGDSIYELPILSENGRWRLGLGPARTNGALEVSAAIRVEGGPVELEPWRRATLQAQVEVLWSNLLTAHATYPPAERAGALVDVLRSLIAPGQYTGARGDRLREGVASFLKAWFHLPAPPAAYTLRSIALRPDGRSATATYALADATIEFPVVFENGRWWLGEG